MELLSGVEMIVHSLCGEDVKYIYGYLDSALLYTYDTLFKEHDVTHILVCHGQAAIHMTDGYARATGKPGAVLVTSDPGAANAITGTATIYTNSILMAILSGQVPSSMVSIDAFQETDMVGISRPIVRHNFIIKHSSEISEVIKKAFYLMQSGRLGSVVVDIPKDMGDLAQKLEYSYPRKVKLRSYSLVIRGRSGQIRRAAEMLLVAKRPVVYFDGGVIMGNVTAPLTELTQMLNLPVTNTLMDPGGYSGTDCQFLGMLGTYGSFTASPAMHHSDMILVVGTCFDDRVISGVAKFCPNAKTTHISIDPMSISKTIKADTPIVGPVDSILTEMVTITREVGETPNQDAQAAWWKQIDEWRGNRGSFPYDKGDGNITKPQAVIETLCEVIRGDAFTTSDVGQHQVPALRYYKFNKPNRWINSGGLGIMDFGFPAMMDIKLNFPDDDVVCVTGKDSTQMDIQKLSTYSQCDLSMKIVNLNNGVLDMACRWQDVQYNSRYSYSYIKFLPDFVKLAETYGHVSMRITDLKDLKPKMEGAFVMKDHLVSLDIQMDASKHVHPMWIRGDVIRDTQLSKVERA